MHETSTLTFSTWGGQQAMSLHEGARATSPIVVVASALGIRASYYKRLVQGLAERGIGAVAVDQIGHGDHPLRPSRAQDWGYDELIDHYRAACARVADHRPQAPLILLGHSLGGQIALMLSGQAPVAGLRKVVLVASGVPYWRCWSGADALKIRAGSTLVRAIAASLGYYPGQRVGFGGLEARTLMLQWAACARHGRYEHGAFRGEGLLAREGVPVHAINVAGDTFAPPQAMHFVLEKLTRREVDYEVWQGAPHGGDHNRWPSAPGFVVDRLDALAADLPDAPRRS